jgi:hypothetical protein
LPNSDWSAAALAPGMETLAKSRKTMSRNPVKRSLLRSSGNRTAL